jgi:hypothetical protein
MVCEAAAVCAMEVEFYDGHPRERLGLEMFHVADHGGGATLDHGGNPLLHLQRRKAGIGPGHAYDGDVDFREDICGRAQEDDRSKQNDGERQHDKRVGSSQR